jgi:hypothetical protein
MQPKQAAFQRHTFNARTATAATKPTFRNAMKRRRGLMPSGVFRAGPLLRQRRPGGVRRAVGVVARRRGGIAHRHAVDDLTERRGS